MKAAILGKKIGMTQVYDQAGDVLPVTVVQAGPCTVMQVKSVDSDGYDAVQLGFEDVKTHRASKPQVGHAAKANAGPKKFVREVRLVEPADLEAGSNVTVESFSEVRFVDVTGTTKGKGFAGAMKRHNFGGQPPTARNANTAARAPSPRTRPTEAPVASPRRASACPVTWATFATPPAIASW